MVALSSDLPALQPWISQGRAQVVQGDMRAFDLPHRFDRIIIPYNGLYTLSSVEEVAECLRCIAAHLTEDGLLCFDGYAVDDEAADAELVVEDTPEDPDDPFTAGGFEYLITVLDGGGSPEAEARRVDVYHQEEAVGLPRRLRAHYRYIIRGPGEAEPIIHHQSIGHHFLTPSMVEPLLRQAGLASVAWWGEFDGQLFDEDSERMIISAGKMAGGQQ